MLVEIRLGGIRWSDELAVCATRVERSMRTRWIGVTDYSSNDSYTLSSEDLKEDVGIRAGCRGHCIPGSRCS